ncbi:MAG: exosortase system-associated protein, TIGR04073 family [Candidatus Omnitrophota bacterium]|nr:exosortase system-associated protein, TIGR04073 family [Candidatus Omnitrophota bacterium]
MKKLLVLICALAIFIPLDLYAQAGLTPTVTLEPIQVKTPAPKKEALYLRGINAPLPDNGFYNDSPANKMGLGVTNLATAWLDITAGVADETKENNVLSGLTFGFGRGLASAFARGSAGLIDILTAGLPPYDEPIVEPEYKVNNPQREGFRIVIFSW